MVKTLKEHIEENDIKIRFWNTKNDIVELNLPLVMFSFLGNSLTLEDYLKIFDLPSVKSRPDDCFSMLVKSRDYISIQKVPSHGGGRDSFVLYSSGCIYCGEGRDFKRGFKNGRCR